MKASAISPVNALLIPLIFGLIAAAIIAAALTGRTLPLISGPRAAVIALLIVGTIMCSAGGISQVGASGRWASPLAIAGYLLGAAILLAAVSVFTGWRLPFIQGEAQAVLAMGGLMAVKILIGTVGYFLRAL